MEKVMNIPFLKHMMRILSIALLYIMSGEISFALSVSSHIVTLVVFFAEGFALGLVLLWGRNMWPGILMGQLVLAVINGLTWPVAGAIALINTAEALLGYRLFHYFRLDSGLNTQRDLFGLIALSVGILQPFSALLGVGTLWIAGSVETPWFLQSLVSWWFGNSMGQILLAPLILSLFSPRSKVRLSPASCWLIGGLTILLFWFIFAVIGLNGSAAVMLITIPPLMFLLVRFKLSGALLYVFSVTILFLATTADGTGPFVENGEVHLLDLHIFILALILMSAYIATVLHEKQENLTELVAAKRNTEVTNQVLESTQFIAKMGSWSTDLARNTHWFSDSFYAVFDLPKRSPFDASAWLEMIHPEDRAQIERITQKIFDDGLYSFSHADYRIVSGKGRIKHLEVYWTYDTDDQGTTTHLNGIVHDVTQRKRAEQKAKEQEALLLHQNRMALQGEMLNMVAHQWRQPLSAIGAIMSRIRVQLEMQGEPNESLDASMDRIESVICDLSQTIDSFMDFYSPSAPLSPQRLGVALQRALQISEKLFQTAGIALHVSDEGTLQPYLYLNEIAQTILNIIKNSIQQCERNRPDMPLITIKTFDEGTHTACLEICDNAGGIADGVIEKIFEPYFSTKPELHGVGLGLYMARITVEKHHAGRIRAKNVDGGVCLKIAIPVKNENSPRSSS